MFIIIIIIIIVIKLRIDSLLLSLLLSFIFHNIVVVVIIIIIIIIIIILHWGSSWGSREVFQPKLPYYAKMGTCPMKNSGITFTFMWNLEPLFIHNPAYTIPLVGHSQGLLHSSCLTWDFLNTSHMFFHEAIRVCIAQATNQCNQYASQATWIWTMWLLLLGFCPSKQYNDPFEPAN